jgi:hypothetical protein
MCSSPGIDNNKPSNPSLFQITIITIIRPALLEPATEAGAGGGAGGNEEDYNELLALDFDWDLLAPSPLLRMDGYHKQSRQAAHGLRPPHADMTGYGLF